MTGPEWIDAALCRQTDPDLWHPEDVGAQNRAVAACLRCPVRQPCLEYALANDERWGVWGGLTETQRKQIKKETAA